MKCILTNEVNFKNKYRMQLPDTIKAIRFIDKISKCNINPVSIHVVFGGKFIPDKASVKQM